MQVSCNPTQRCLQVESSGCVSTWTLLSSVCYLLRASSIFGGGGVVCVHMCV